MFESYDIGPLPVRGQMRSFFEKAPKSSSKVSNCSSWHKHYEYNKIVLINPFTFKLEAFVSM